MENQPITPDSNEEKTDSMESFFDVEGGEIIRPTKRRDIAELLKRAADDEVEIEFAVDENDPQKSIIVVKEKD